MSKRIERAFVRANGEKRAAFIPYITAGDPSAALTVSLVLELERVGADIIELGVPFTDPIADGPTIQRSAERALAAGTTLQGVLQIVKEVRFQSQVPIILFTYYNPVHAMGLARFAVAASGAGIDGVILTDVPVEEASGMAEQLNRVGIALIPLIAPTSTRERIKAMRKVAGSFVYFVSRTGITGTRRYLPEGLQEQLEVVGKLVKTRVAVGFGISTAEQVNEVARFADGVVVGSALVERIASQGASAEMPGEVGALARSFALATRRP